jgi:hypothetical protein
MDALSKILYKYIFIIKAAADGWTVKFLGENTFQFFKPRKRKLSDRG